MALKNNTVSKNLAYSKNWVKQACQRTKGVDAAFFMVMLKLCAGKKPLITS